LNGDDFHFNEFPSFILKNAGWVFLVKIRNLISSDTLVSIVK